MVGMKRWAIALSLALAIENAAFGMPVMADEIYVETEDTATEQKKDKLEVQDTSATGVDVSEARDGSVLADYDTATGVLRIYPGTGGTRILNKYFKNEQLGISCEDFKKITVESGVKAPEEADGLFAGFENAEIIDVSGLDTSSVTFMYSMFDGCERLESLDVSSFNTSNVVNMTGMFEGCKSLKSLDLSSFNTSNVESMGSMFFGCYSLESLDVSKFDTSKVTDMSYMFDVCMSLKSLDLSSFNTSNVESMGDMFRNCNSLESLDVSKFDTSKVKYMGHMFEDCKSLKSLDVSKFDTSQVITMDYMFSECESLESLNVSKLDTSKVIDMSAMFRTCESLKSLDVSSFNTSNARIMDSMFELCKCIESLDLSGFDTSNVFNVADMFAGCEKLKNLDLSNFDLSNLKDEFFVGVRRTGEIVYEKPGEYEEPLEWYYEHDPYSSTAAYCMLSALFSLELIKTPKKIAPSFNQIEIDVDVYGKMYDDDGNTYEYLPIDGSKTLHIVKTDEGEDTPSNNNPDENKDTPSNNKSDESKDTPSNNKPDESKDTPSENNPDESKDTPSNNKPDESKDTPSNNNPDGSKDTPSSNKSEESEETPESLGYRPVAIAHAGVMTAGNTIVTFYDFVEYNGKTYEKNLLADKSITIEYDGKKFTVTKGTIKRMKGAVPTTMFGSVILNTQAENPAFSDHSNANAELIIKKVTGGTSKENKEIVKLLKSEKLPVTMIPRDLTAAVDSGDIKITKVSKNKKGVKVTLQFSDGTKATISNGKKDSFKNKSKVSYDESTKRVSIDSGDINGSFNLSAAQKTKGFN